VPKRFGCFHEPFLGGGALYFALQPEHASLSDDNERLISTYSGVRDDIDTVVKTLSKWPYDKEFYLKCRARPIDGEPANQVAAWMIYLNKAGFNGLYRVNRKGQFNVPFGRYSNPRICDEPNLRACSSLLGQTELKNGDFGRVLQDAKKGDFVYFDPPYVPVSPTASFTSYTSRGFNAADQLRLRDTALALKHRGVKVLLSNSDTEMVHRLYGRGFRMRMVQANRNINCKAGKRGKVGEVIIW
jgi:DNA adenine methylase